MIPIRTLAEWQRGNEPFHVFFRRGTRVSADLAMYFLECVPPASFERGYFQVGEASKHVGGRPLFSTFRKESSSSDVWVYLGECFHRSTEEARLGCGHLHTSYSPGRDACLACEESSDG